MAWSAAPPTDEAAEAADTQADASREGDFGDSVYAVQSDSLERLVDPGKELAPADCDKDADGLVRSRFNPYSWLPVLQCLSRLLNETRQSTEEAC